LERHVAYVTEIRNLNKKFVGKFDEKEGLLGRTELIWVEARVAAAAGRFLQPNLVGPCLVKTGVLRR
jgi:hypothetical protein